MPMNHNNQPSPIPPPSGAIRVDPDSTPLEKLGLPMDDVKDLLALQGAGSFSRQVKVGVRKQAADAAGCLLIGGVIVAALLIGFVLLVCSSSANRYTGLVEDSATKEAVAEETAKLTAESPRIAAAFDLLIFDIKSKYNWGSEWEASTRKVGPDSIETKYWQKIIDLARDPYVRDLLESDLINLLQLQGRSLPPQTVPEAFDRIIGDIKHVWSDRGDTSRWERSLRKLGPDDVDKQYWKNIISQARDQQTHDLLENDLRTLLQSQGRSRQ